MGKPTSSHRPSSILRQRFDTLLRTWHVNIHRRRIPVQLKDWITSDGQLNEDALEERYGIGKYGDRSITLSTALNALQKKSKQVDSDRIWNILNDAKADLVLW